jgi:hypothetical protein
MTPSAPPVKTFRVLMKLPDRVEGSTLVGRFVWVEATRQEALDYCNGVVDWQQKKGKTPAAAGTFLGADDWLGKLWRRISQF